MSPWPITGLSFRPILTALSTCLGIGLLTQHAKRYTRWAEHTSRGGRAEHTSRGE
jgi:hypothetical protein